MSSIGRKRKKAARLEKEEKQGKQILIGISIVAICLVVLMLIWYSLR